MKFETINKDSDLLKSAQLEPKIFMTVKDRGFYFSKEVSKKFGFKPGLYVHFVRGMNNINLPDGRWYICCNEMESGFKLINGSHDATFAMTRSMVRLFRQQTSCSLGDSLPLKETKSEHNGCKVIEVVLPSKINTK